MSYRRQDLQRLVQPDRVHRDLYISPELFALEQRHFFANTWSYLGHTSQVPQACDYLAVDIAGRPLMMVRQPDGGIRVLQNRCPHKGSPLVGEASGNVGKFMRCPYHAWTFKLDGAPLAVPLKAAYEGTALKDCESGQGMVALKHAVAPLMEAVGKLTSGRVPPVCANSRDYFRDVYDHLTRINAQLETVRDTIGTAIQVSLSSVAIEQSDVAKRLAAWAGIFAAATAFAGIWGMNFKAMPELQWEYGYPMALGIIVSACTLLFLRFRRMGWL